MDKRMKRNHIVVALLIVISTGTIATAKNFNVLMMEATCKITGQSVIAGKVIWGTGFVIGKLDEKNPLKGFHVLVTANHVLRDAKGEQIKLTFRQKQKDNSWKRIEHPLQIRDKKKQLWKKHPDVDVAAIFVVDLPKNVVTDLLSTDYLIDDKKLKEYEIHPGQELLCLGYPLGAEANTLGFPILRSGRIASYPITPTKIHKTFKFDFTVFKGNSGGPVYYVQKNPTYRRTLTVGMSRHKIVGIVVEEIVVPQKVQFSYEVRVELKQLQLGEVIHATFIKELVDSMGIPKPKAKSK